MRDLVDSMAVRKAIQRLGKVYFKGSSRDDLTDVWLEVLAGLTKWELDRAVAEYLSSNAAYFPTPGQLLELGFEVRTRATASRKMGGPIEYETPGAAYQAWALTTFEDPCPVCGAAWGPLPDGANRNPRFMGAAWHSPLKPLSNGVIHDAAKHVAAEIPVRWREKTGVWHDGFWH